MRIINYQSENSKILERYVDIGSCERDYYSINFYLPGENENKSGKIYFENYNAWFNNFKSESMGSKMIILNYYLSQFMGWDLGKNTPQTNYFKNVYGEKTTCVIIDNLEYFLTFNDKWFENQVPIFKGLDLDWDDIAERFVRVEETDEGIITEIEFEDGSIISFLDEDDSYRSLFVPESEYHDLKNEVEYIVSKFQP